MFLIQYPWSDIFLIIDWLTEDFTEGTIIWIQPCVYTPDSCLSLDLNWPKFWLQMFPCFCKSHGLSFLGKAQNTGWTQRNDFTSFKNTPALQHTVGLVIPVDDETSYEKIMSFCNFFPVGKAGGVCSKCGHKSVTGQMNLLTYYWAKAETFSWYKYC